jgi:peptide deformylase
MIRPILRFGERALHEPAAAVEAVTAEIQELIDDMVATMYAAPGIGLAAPQIGVPLRVFVVDLSVGRDRHGLITLVNPEYVEQDGTQDEEEGCLSVPGFNATVVRPARIVVRGLDRSGRPVQHEGTGLLARAFQHEMDHLDGTLFVDRLRGLKRELILAKIRKRVRTGKW